MRVIIGAALPIPVIKGTFCNVFMVTFGFGAIEHGRDGLAVFLPIIPEPDASEESIISDNTGLYQMNEAAAYVQWVEQTLTPVQTLHQRICRLLEGADARREQQIQMQPVPMHGDANHFITSREKRA